VFEEATSEPANFYSKQQFKGEGFGVEYINHVAYEWYLKAQKKARKDGKELHADYQIARQYFMTEVGTKENRKMRTYLYRTHSVLLALLMLVLTVQQTYASYTEGEFTMLSFLPSIVIYYWAEDLMGGIVHIVLDEEKNLDHPILWEAVLLFRWHHIIPRDLARKDFFNVTQDMLEIGWFGHVFLVYLPAYIGILPVGRGDILPFLLIKMVYAILGQAAHRAAHKSSDECNWFETAMQKCRMFIQREEHNKHHKNHDHRFTITNGSMNYLIDGAYRLTRNRHFWIFMLVLDIFDGALFGYIFNTRLTGFSDIFRVSSVAAVS